MSFSQAVLWWEEWHLRVLVLGSLFLQYFLYFAAPLRKRCIPSWFRFIIWLAYLGSDALAIYALAALFNRHKKQWVSTHHSDASLEALWAPILLVHLGGVDAITAYNIEDNELWRRHVLTTVSQIAVVIYVFHKSWSGDKRLLQAAILIFVAGVMKCSEKPVALRSASISSLMNRGELPDTRDDLMTRLEEFYNPFIDRPPRSIEDEAASHEELRRVLSLSFYRLYTKEQVSGASLLLIFLHFGISVMNSHRNETEAFQESIRFILLLEAKRLLRLGIRRRVICGYLLRAVVNPMIFTALGLFHKSHVRAYNSTDVKVTYTLLSCTASLEYIGLLWTFAHINVVRNADRTFLHEILVWPDQIAQYNLIAYSASKKKHWILMSIAAFLGCEDYLDSLWSLKPFKSSRDITDLVRGYIETWKKPPTGPSTTTEATNRAFNDNRGHWTLEKQGCGGSKILRQSLRRPFDESVLLWHLATEFCYFDRVDNTGYDATRHSKVISNYMVYLLFVNPEMLITGARPSLFRDEYKRLKGMPLDDGEPTPDKTTLREEELAKKIINKLKGGTQDEEGVAHKAWELSEHLMVLFEGDSEKMWKVIEGVWVEMLCFSASRCRGYLHAKSLGKGGEYLSYIWLLLWGIGMVTVADKTQRAPELPEQEDDSASGGGVEFPDTTSATPAEAIIGDENEKAEPQEEEGSNVGAACTTPATTVIGDEITEEDDGSQCTTTAAPTTPITGDENV